MFSPACYVDNKWDGLRPSVHSIQLAASIFDACNLLLESRHCRVSISARYESVHGYLFSIMHTLGPQATQCSNKMLQILSASPYSGGGAPACAGG